VPFIHWERVETFLPKMTAPLMTEIDVARLAFVSLAERFAKPIGRLGHENEMGMIGHQTVRPAGRCGEPAGIG
jgi:hypothetical protein